MHDQALAPSQDSIGRERVRTAQRPHTRAQREKKSPKNPPRGEISLRGRGPGAVHASQPGSVSVRRISVDMVITEMDCPDHHRRMVAALRDKNNNRERLTRHTLLPGRNWVLERVVSAVLGGCRFESLGISRNKNGAVGGRGDMSNVKRQPARGMQFCGQGQDHGLVSPVPHCPAHKKIFFTCRHRKD